MQIPEIIGSITQTQAGEKIVKSKIEIIACIFGHHAQCDPGACIK